MTSTNGNGNRSMIPVIVIDDFALNRECLVDRLSTRYADIRCAWDLPSFFREVECRIPQLILIDVSALAATNLIQMALDLNPQPQVIVYGLSHEAEVIACAEAGATGLLLRSETVKQLFVLMQEAINGRAHCSTEVSAMLLGRVYSGVAGWSTTDPDLNSLTAREREILLLIQEGLSNQQIATRLHVTIHTVKNHVHSLLTKLGVVSRAEASRVARALKYSGSGARPAPAELTSR